MPAKTPLYVYLGKYDKISSGFGLSVGFGDSVTFELAVCSGVLVAFGTSELIGADVTSSGILVGDITAVGVDVDAIVEFDIFVALVSFRL